MYIFFYEYIIMYNYKFRYKNSVYIFTILLTFHLLSSPDAQRKSGGELSSPEVVEEKQR